MTAVAIAMLAAGLAAPPHLVGTPHATTAIVDGAVSVGVHVRLDRRFADSAEQRRYAVVAAPHLQTGQRLPQELFGGTSLGRIGHREAPWYAAEALQLRKRASVAAQTRAGRSRWCAGTASSARSRPCGCVRSPPAARPSGRRRWSQPRLEWSYSSGRM